MVRKSTEFVKGQIREYTFLRQDGRFVTIPELPEFCWTELIVNAIGHRDYSIAGTDIRIKMFDNHFAVESPGTLPSLVRTNNIREIHFSRNPKIFEFLHEYEYVKEFGEGVNRIYLEMEAAGLPEQEYHTVEFMLYATLKNHKWVENQNAPQVAPQVKLSYEEKLLAFCAVPHSQTKMIDFLGLSDRKHFRKAYLKPLLDSGKLVMTIPDKPNSRNRKYVRASKP